MERTDRPNGAARECPDLCEGKSRIAALLDQRLQATRPVRARSHSYPPQYAVIDALKLSRASGIAIEKLAGESFEE